MNPAVLNPILPGANQEKTYGLDGVGNWKTKNLDTVASGGGINVTAEMRQHNYANQITFGRDIVNGGSPSSTTFIYDHGNNASSDDPAAQKRGNGNLVTGGPQMNSTSQP